MDHPLPGNVVNVLRTNFCLFIGLLLFPHGGPALADEANGAPRTVVEALIDGPSELRVTRAGIYWKNIANAKPGRHEGRNEPTYVDDQPWKPRWKDASKDRGADTSDVRSIALDPDKLQFELFAVGSTHGGTGIEKRRAITVKKVGDELSVLIPDPEGGSKWYRFALVHYTGPTPFPLVLGSGAGSASPASTAPGDSKTTPSPAVSPEAAELVKANRSNLVFVTTPDGAGSGFVAAYGTGTFLITNAHVAAGAKGAMFKTLDGTQVQIGAPAAAVGHDIFLMALAPGGAPLPVMTGVDENASIGDAVVVLGNAEGAGVINTLTGKIVGLGPNLVEVDAAFQPGNSGSPIIHLKTGKVIGVATYLTIRKYDGATKEAVKDPIVRRFGYRLDSVKTWQPVNWQGFHAQAMEMEAVEELTNDLVAFLRDLGKNGKVSRGAHTNPLIKTRIDQWLDARSKRLSPRDAAMADQSMLSFLKVTCQSDITAAQARITYDYFQRQLADQQRERAEIAGVFSKIIENLRP